MTDASDRGRYLPGVVEARRDVAKQMLNQQQLDAAWHEGWRARDCDCDCNVYSGTRDSDFEGWRALCAMNAAEPVETQELNDTIFRGRETPRMTQWQQARYVLGVFGLVVLYVVCGLGLVLLGVWAWGLR